MIDCIANRGLISNSRPFSPGWLVVLAALCGVLNTAAERISEDHFDYPDGALVEAAPERWRHHSGGVTGEVQIVNGVMVLNQAESEDAHALLPGGPYTVDSGKRLFARFSVAFNELPKGASGGYFAHFKDGGNGFLCRVFATTNGATAGYFRLGVASASSTATNTFPLDIGLNESHTVICSVETATAASRLWLDAAQETDAQIEAADTGSPKSVAAFAFRQASGMGSLRVDDLVLATSFVELFSTNTLPIDPPVITFTNYLARLARPGEAITNQHEELTLQPGEQWTLETRVTDPAGLPLTLELSTNALPSGAVWHWETNAPGNLLGRFDCAPNEADAGREYEIKLQAGNGSAMASQTWKLYVPAVPERAVVLNEFLANPSSTELAPHFNPLRREVPAAKPATEDEYIEFVNASSNAVSLGGWSVEDAVRVRHVLAPDTVMPPGGALIVYGGPATNNLPRLDVPAFPASESTAGLALNNSGIEMILLRNAQGRLVSRLAYDGSMLSTNSALTRFPDLNGPFAAQGEVSMNYATPGCKADGTPFVGGDTQPLPRPTLLIARNPDHQVVIQWRADANLSYSIWQTPSAVGTFEILQGGLQFTNDTGQFVDPDASQTPERYYRVSSP